MLRAHNSKESAYNASKPDLVNVNNTWKNKFILFLAYSLQDTSHKLTNPI